jgi:hypothetical protein
MCVGVEGAPRCGHRTRSAVGHEACAGHGAGAGHGVARGARHDVGTGHGAAQAPTWNRRIRCGHPDASPVRMSTGARHTVFLNHMANFIHWRRLYIIYHKTKNKARELTVPSVILFRLHSSPCQLMWHLVCIFAAMFNWYILNPLHNVLHLS